MALEGAGGLNHRVGGVFDVVVSRSRVAVRAERAQRECHETGRAV